MTIETVTPKAVAISISRAELGTRETLSPNQAREAVRCALLSGGQEPWAKMEIELFAAETEVLLIARPVSFQPRRFRFRNFDDLAAALSYFPENVDSDVVYIDGGFELLMREDEDDALPNALFEFGEELPCTTELCMHISEHGDIVAEKNAVETLQRYFC